MLHRGFAHGGQAVKAAGMMFGHWFPPHHHCLAGAF